jgi:hypothetical protein
MVSAQRRAKEKARNARRKLRKRFDAAAAELSLTYDNYHRLLPSYLTRLRLPQKYVDGLPRLVEAIAPTPPGKRIGASDKLKRLTSYKACAAVLNQFRSFTDDTRLVELLPAGETLGLRIHGLKLNADSIQTMKQMKAEYFEIADLIEPGYQVVLDILTAKSKRLPLSYEEYKEKAPTFNGEIYGLSPREQRPIIRRTFPGLWNRYSPHIVRPR